MTASRAPGARWLAVSNVGTLLLGLVSAPLVARGLGVSGRGEYGMLIALGPALAIMFGFGISWASRAALAAGHLSPGDLIRTTRRAARWLVPIGLIFGWSLGQLLFGERLHEIATALYISACFSSVLRTTYGSVLLFEGRLARLSWYAALPSLVSVGVVVVASALDRLTLPVALIGAWAGLISQSAMIPRQRGVSRPDVGVRNLALRGARVWPMQVAEQVYLRSDVLAVYLLCGARVAGLYAIPAIGTQVSYGLMTAMNAPMYRVASDGLQFQTFLRDNVAGTFALMLLTWPVALVISPWLIPVLFGGEFSSAETLLPLGWAMSLAMVAWLPAIHGTVLQNRLSAAGRWAVLSVPGVVLALLSASRVTAPWVVVLSLAAAQVMVGGAILVLVNRLGASAFVPNLRVLRRFFL